MANPTTNFGWQMPTSSDLVTDLPADFEVFGQAVDTALVDLKGGTTGQILAKASNTNMDFTWITNDVGDITAVTAGSGLSGGGTTGAVSLALDLASANVFTAAQTATRFIVTGSTVATNGMYLIGANSLGFSTNSAVALQINATGETSIGSTAPTVGRPLTINKTLTGNVNAYAININSAIQSDVTSNAAYVRTFPSTAAAAFTCGSLFNFHAGALSLGAASTVSTHYQFYAEATSAATNNFAFYSDIVAGTNRWNFYAAGTAVNYFAGRTGVGVLLTTSAQFGVTNQQGTGEVTVLTRNFAAQTANSISVQSSAASQIWGVSAAGLMQYISGNTATTVGAAGGASALPATPTGYLKIDIGGTTFKVPYYAN